VSEMRVKLMDLGEELIETMGYNAFSYRDLSKRAGITTASIHYHFPTKNELACAIALRARECLGRYFAELDAGNHSGLEKIRLFADQFIGTLNKQLRMCMFGMLAAEQHTLSEELKTEVRAFFNESEAWLTKLLRDAIRNKEIPPRANLARQARIIMAALEGSMLIARVQVEKNRLKESVEDIISRLSSSEH
jgi:TetR/AcrR family transcriptional regulator, transcriptional repressor for nem operon